MNSWEPPSPDPLCDEECDPDEAGSTDSTGRRRAQYEIPSNTSLAKARKPSRSASSSSSSGEVPTTAIARTTDESLPPFTGAAAGLYRFLVRC